MPGGGNEATEPLEEDGYEMPADLPVTLAEALGRLEASEALTELLGKPFVDAFISTKQLELNNANGDITPWERRYLGALV